jgi:hypothetical protein
MTALAIPAGVTIIGAILVVLAVRAARDTRRADNATQALLEGALDDARRRPQ